MSSNHLPGDLPSFAATERADVGIGFGLGAVAVLLSNGSDFLSAVPQLVASIL